MDYIISLSCFISGSLFSYLILNSKLRNSQNNIIKAEELEEKLNSEKINTQNALNQIVTLETVASMNEKSYNSLKTESDKLELKYKELLVDITSLSKENEFLRREIERLKGEEDEKRRQYSIEFKNLANNILENNSKRFSDQHNIELKSIIEPLKENIESFKKKVESSYDSESKQRFSLEEKIKELVELNSRISEEARNLTKALKGDNKVQGDWGEMILEGILERSGLQKDREYFIQETIKDESGFAIVSENGKRMRPDIILKYPDNRKIIIDSKVSLSAFIRMSETDVKEEYNIALKQHLSSVKSHVEELSSKKYHHYTNDSLDFVMMFIPNEAAYLAAIQSDQSIWQYAYDRRVVIISPTNLITALKLIADLWKRDKQSKNSIEIAKRGGMLYDKFVTLCGKIEDSRNKLRQALNGMDDTIQTMKTGNGNLYGQVEKLKELGAKAQKQLMIDNDSLEQNIIEQSEHKD